MAGYYLWGLFDARLKHTIFLNRDKGGNFESMNDSVNNIQKSNESEYPKKMVKHVHGTVNSKMVSLGINFLKTMVTPMAIQESDVIKKICNSKYRYHDYRLT